jgi:hypothetical protein
VLARQVPGPPGHLQPDGSHVRRLLDQVDGVGEEPGQSPA